uniref:Fibronectin type-III domain-containing protein n=1 Tax=Amphimedon queenslandica TaxID=400682 RepID=A0A1X7U2T4_AMPQE
MTATKTTLELSCLGCPFQLGMLYDCRNDSFIPGITLWDSLVLKAALSEISQISSSFEVTAEDSVSSKMLQLGVEAGLSLSVLSGLVEVSGSAKYLDDRKTSDSHCRVTLKCNCKTNFQQLTMEHLAVSKIQHPDIFEKKIATHVVTGILFGAEAFFIFDREVASNENSHNIQGQMEVLVKAIPRINEIKGSTALNINDQEKKETEKFQCKFYGDLILQTNPSSFQDAVKVYKELPLHFLGKGGSTVPKKVSLYPLNSLDSKAARMVREISIGLVTQVQEAFDALNCIEIRSNDLINTEIYDCLSTLKDQMSQFQIMIKEHRTDFMKQLSAVLPTIRGGGAEEQVLASLLEDIDKSPFNARSLKEWIKRKEEGIKAFTQFLNILKKVKGIKFSFGAGDLESAVSNVDHNHILSFEFNVFKKDDPFLQSMHSFLHNKESNQSTPASFAPWFKTKAVIQDLRHKIKQFSSFCEINAGNKEVSFIAPDSSEDATMGKGAAIVHYEYGMLAGEFDPPGRPGKPTVISIEHDSIKLEWKAPQYGSSSIDSYTVSLQCTSESPEKWSNQVIKEKETTITLNQLEPDTNEESEISDIIQTKSPMVDIKLQNIIADSKVIERGPPVVYQIKARPVRLTKGYGNIAKMEFGIPIDRNKPTKVLLVVGATGAGKSTLINAMVNYFLGVKWEHEFRLKLIHDEVTQSQAHSQTQMITAYTFYWQKASPLNCNLTIIDTPGFGDTRGLERDQQITRHIREFFEMKGRMGWIHCMGLVLLLTHH